MFVLAISCGSEFQQFIAVPFPVSWAPWASSNPSFFTFFSSSQGTVRLLSFCSLMCCRKLLHVSSAPFIWVISKSAGVTYTEQHLGSLANFPVNVWAVLVPGFALESFPLSFSVWVAAGLLEHFCSLVLGCWHFCSWGHWSACICYIVCSCRAMCPLITLSWRGCQQEEDKTYSASEMAWRGFSHMWEKTSSCPFRKCLIFTAMPKCSCSQRARAWLRTAANRHSQPCTAWCEQVAVFT